jgi:hypothetical protein
MAEQAWTTHLRDRPAEKLRSEQPESQLEEDSGSVDLLEPVDDVDDLLEVAGLDEEGEPDGNPFRENKIWLNWSRRSSGPGQISIVLEWQIVRLYLEIGGIDLLNTDREFRLATQMEAARRIDALVRQHPRPQGDCSAQHLPRPLRRTLHQQSGSSRIQPPGI